MKTFFSDFLVCLCSIIFNSLQLWTVACQAPLSMGFLRQEYWCGLPFPPPGDLPDPGNLPHPGIKPASLVCPALAGRFLGEDI